MSCPDATIRESLGRGLAPQHPGPLGFAQLAELLTCDKEHSASLFRSYERLAARNLLYIQSELRELESRFEELDRHDLEQGIDGCRLAMNWPLERDEADPVLTDHIENRIELVNSLRAKIKEYQKAVLRNGQMYQYDRPSKQVHEAFKTSFRNLDSNFPSPKLAGHNADLYDHRDDLVTLMHHRDDDRLTTFLRETFPSLFKRPKPVMGGNVESLSEYRLQVFVGGVNLIVSSGMLFGAVYVLYHVKNVERRLAIIATFTILFAFCIGLLTNARRSEIFAACAAYAAVLVVFVSGNLNN